MSRLELLCLSADDVRRALPMASAIEAMASAFAALSAGEAVAPLRTRLEVPGGDGVALVMPVALPATGRLGLKVVTVLDGNPQIGLPAIHGLVMVFRSTDGAPEALVDGEVLTAIRTGAASGLATRLLARNDAKAVAVVGAGPQGETQLEAVCAVRDIEEAGVLDLDRGRAQAFAAEMTARLGLPIRVLDGSGDLRSADVICTATPARAPVLSSRDLKKGVHLNAVGGFRPGMCEIPGEVVAGARVVVDSRAACTVEAGELVSAIKSGMIDPGTRWAELGEVVAGNAVGRTSDDQVTLFKSVGNAVQDLAAAALAVEGARALGLGTTVDMGS